MADNKILQKLRKLKALQDSAEKIGSEQEALNAASKIAAIVQEYNISITELEYEDVKNNIIHKCVRLRDIYHTIGGKWRIYLWHILAKSVYCQSYVSKGGGRIKEEFGDVVIVGQECNIETLEWMFNDIAFRIVELSKQRWKESKDSMKCSKDKFQRDYLMGVVSSLSMRLIKEKEERERQANSSAVVLYNDKAILAYANDLFGRVRNSKGRVKINANGAYRQGVSDGMNVNINGKPVGSGVKQLGMGH